MVLDAQRGLAVRTAATVGELLEAWFDLARYDFSPKTVRETRGVLDHYLLPGLGTVRLVKLKASDLDSFYRRLAASGGAGGAPLAPGTVRRVHGILRRALSQGVKWGWIGVNPASAATPPRVPVSDIRPPSGPDLVRILKRAVETEPELACFLVVASASGARRTDLVALRWSDVDLARRTLVIQRGIVSGPDGLVEKDTKTHASRRIGLDGQTVQLLSEHRDLTHKRAALCGVSISDAAFVFSNAVDATVPWYPDSVSRSSRRLARAEGLTGVRLHDLRHFVATQLLSAEQIRAAAAGKTQPLTATTDRIPAANPRQPAGVQ
jgi:integrase